MNLHDRDIKKQAYNDGIQQGIYENSIETAKNMLLASLGTMEQIAQITNLPLQIVEDLAKTNKEI